VGGDKKYTVEWDDKARKEAGTGKAESVSGILSFGDGSGVRFAADLGTVPTGGEQVAGPKNTATPPWWTLVLGALFGGLLLNIMPCVFPILSLKAIALARAGESEAKARAEGLAYTAGVVLACIALGGLLLALRAAGTQVGWAFQLQDPGVVALLLLLATAITANFAGLYELPGLSIESSGGAAKGGWLGAFGTGLLAAFVATPCTGPFMAAAVGAALILPAWAAMAGFAALGFGLALPFLREG
jgi:thiol:disulfide interchange protein